ncbi:helix-turn-helix domain-containing protein [Nocardia sp. NPDC004260]
MTEQGVGKWLRRHGFSPQRPARRSYRQKPEKVAEWLEVSYPAIAARARGENAVVAWADQCGHCAATPLRRAGPGHRRAALRWCGSTASACV